MTTTPDDMMAWGREAMGVAAELNLELVRDGKELIQGPAVGTKLDKKERLAQARALLASPDNIAAMFDQMSAQYQLTAEKPIPRRLVHRLLRANREVEEADNAT